MSSLYCLLFPRASFPEFAPFTEMTQLQSICLSLWKTDRNEYICIYIIIIFRYIECILVRTLTIPVFRPFRKVSLAYDSNNGACLALKFFNTCNEGRRLFANETAIIAVLPPHPALPSLVGVGSLNGNKFIAMKYLPYLNLAAYLESHGPMPEEKALQVGRQMVLSSPLLSL